MSKKQNKRVSDHTSLTIDHVPDGVRPMKPKEHKEMKPKDRNDHKEKDHKAKANSEDSLDRLKPKDYVPAGNQFVTSVMRRLIQRGMTIACAESLTGGALAATCVSVPGSSSVFRGGVVSYATDVKAHVLGVDTGRLKQTGPVDQQVALQMARGAQAVLAADIGLSTTGVAGPGEEYGLPAGTVWIACTGVLGDIAQLHHFEGSRAQVRAQSVRAALRLVDSLLTTPTATNRM
ncbi:MAG: CinA family protein [Actinomycetaceae bacterium]|nr:CinA family protein [Actinomycetaceae bacterium]